MINKLKKHIAVFTAVVAAVVFFAVSASAAENSFEGLTVGYKLANGFEYSTELFSKYYPEKTEEETQVSEEPEEEWVPTEYAVVLPYGVENTAVTLNMPQGEILLIDGTEFTDGSSTVLARGTHSVSWKGAEYTLYVMYTSNIPQVYITTAEDGMEKVHADKAHREPGQIVITDGNVTEYSGELEYIKGRGNATWEADKKPYNIKLDKKSSLFDMGISKKYALMANAADDTVLKNRIGMEFAEDTGIDYNMQSQHVDLYINNEYMGNYLLAERVEVDTYRVNITDLEAINEAANPGVDLDTLPTANEKGSSYSEKGAYKWVDVPNELSGNLGGGYLLGFEIGWRYNIERCGFVSNYGQPVVINGPENATKSQVEYIKNYYCEFEEAVLSADGYNSKGKHYSDYIDVESFAKMYLMQEFAQNLDAAITSFYLYKDVNGKLTACTAWDMDMAFGKKIERWGYDLSKTDNIWVMNNHLIDADRTKVKTIFTLLCQHADFRSELVAEWHKSFVPEIPALINNINQLYGTINDSAVADRYKWNVTATTPDVAYNDYYAYVEALKFYITARNDFLSAYLRMGDTYLQYSANGGEGVVIDKKGYAEGDMATAGENTFTYGEAQFTGWNTKADGSGVAYMPGDTVDMAENVTLYAQWNGVEAENQQSEETAAQPQNSGGVIFTIINWFKSLLN